MKDNFLKVKASILEQIQIMEDVVQRVMPDLKADIEALDHQFQNDLAFTVLCLGDFSSGKTTFVNRFFLGDPVLPVRATPTTAKITTIRYGSPMTLSLILKDGQVERYSENISDVVKQAGAKDGQKLDEVVAIELQIPSEELKDGIIIVDSPGLNDPEIERSKLTIDYMDRCDCILFFVNATQAWKRSEKEFIEERIFSKQHFNKIFFLINFWDCIVEDERPEVLRYVKDQMGKSTQIMKSNLQGQEEEINEPVLIPVSAKSGENIEHLEKTLWTYLADKRGQNLLKIKITKVYKFIESTLERIGESAIIYQKEQNQIEKDIEQLKIEVEQFAHGVETFRSELFNRLNPFWENYVEDIKRLFADIKTKAAREIAAGVNNIQAFSDKADIEKMLTNRMRRVLHQYQNKFKGFEMTFIDDCKCQISAMKADLNLRRSSLVDFKSTSDAIELNDLCIDENMMTLLFGVGGMLAVAAILGVMTGGIGSLLAPAVLPFVEKYRMNQIRENLQERLPELEDNIKEVLNAQLQEIIQSRDKLLGTIFENTRSEILELYREKNRLLDEAMKNKEENKDKAILAQIETAKQELASVKNRLSTLVEEAFKTA